MGRGRRSHRDLLALLPVQGDLACRHDDRHADGFPARAADGARRLLALSRGLRSLFDHRRAPHSRRQHAQPFQGETTLMNAAASAPHRLGLMLVALAALFWSTSGIFVRLISADLMTLLFLRGVFSGSAVMLVHLLLEG